LDFDFDTLAYHLSLSRIKYISKNSNLTSFHLQPQTIAPITSTGLMILELQFFEVVDDTYYPLTLKAKEVKLIDIN